MVRSRRTLKWPMLAALACAHRPTDPIADGQWIAFGECSPSVSQIVIARPDGTERHAVTRNPAPSWFPAWSPDGRQLAYVYETMGGFQLWIVDADGANNHPVVTVGHSLAPSWSHDGRRLAFAHTESSSAAFKIWSIDVDGRDARQVTTTAAAMTDENVPRWSPDDRSLVFTSNASGYYEIWVADVATGSRRALTTSYRDTLLHAQIEQKVPAWSPDGASIAYWAGVEGSDPRPMLPRSVWIMHGDGTGQRELVAGDDPNWSPDGRQILYSTDAGRRPALGAVSPDGSGAHVLFAVTACRSLQSSWRR